MDTKKAFKAFRGTGKSLAQLFPLFLAVLMLIALFLAFVSEGMLKQVFTGNLFLDPLFGALAGSIAAGNPMNSYIIGGALHESGVTLLAVTAFIVCWASVGVAQAPAEVLFFGKRFTLARNALAFLFALLISLATVSLLWVIT